MKCERCGKVSHGKTYVETPVGMDTGWVPDSDWAHCPNCGAEQ